ncbi:MAG: LLM class F420-dependent oxidoreductase [Thermodesulfobacteriota bacterium]
MKYGLLMFSTDYAMRPADLARAAEERGFESLLFPEHTHIPVSRISPWPGGAALPKEYWHTNDVFVALATAAQATSRIKLGTGICLVVEHDPIVLAKQVATLDQLSDGRLLFGIGGGWNAEEMANHGTDFKRRWKVLRERIAAMKEIWTKEEASYHGEYVDFDPIWSWPKPAQKPHPPILLGTGSARGRQRVVDYCDGWMPIAGRDDVLAGIADLRVRAEAARRDPATISITIFGAPAKPERIDEYRKAGVERVVFGLPPADRDTVLPIADRYAELMRALG